MIEMNLYSYSRIFWNFERRAKISSVLWMQHFCTFISRERAISCQLIVLLVDHCPVWTIFFGKLWCHILSL